jgi:hypothetical protein
LTVKRTEFRHGSAWKGQLLPNGLWEEEEIESNYLIGQSLFRTSDWRMMKKSVIGCISTNGLLQFLRVSSVEGEASCQLLASKNIDNFDEAKVFRLENGLLVTGI